MMQKIQKSLFQIQLFSFFCPCGHLMGYHLPNVDNRGHLANYHLPNFVHVFIERPLDCQKIIKTQSKNFLVSYLITKSIEPPYTLAQEATLALTQATPMQKKEDILTMPMILFLILSHCELKKF